MTCRLRCLDIGMQRVSYDEAVEMMRDKGIPTGLLTKTNRNGRVPLTIMHAIDPTYYRCRKCDIYLRSDDARCPCCRQVLSISSLSKGSVSVTKERNRRTATAIRAALRSAREAGR